MKVSVYIPTYNNIRFLPDCLESILSQSFQDFEVVIADDGSQDGSHEFILDYQARYPDKIRYYWHADHGHKGFAATCNLAIQQTKGEYIARNDSDDIWYPDKLKKQISILDKDPDIGLVYSCASMINGGGNEIPGLYGADVTSDKNPLGRILIAQLIPENTAVIRRKVLDEIGQYDESLIASDWDLMVRIFSHYKAAFINTPLAKYRIHDHNLSKGVDPKIKLKRLIDVFRKIEQKSTNIGGALLDTRNLAILYLQLAFHIFCLGEEEEAVTYLHRAFQKDSSLVWDTAFFNFWLNYWKPAFYTINHNHFGFWVISHLPSSITPATRKELADSQLSLPDTIDFFVQRGIQWGQLLAKPTNLANIFDDCPGDITLPRVWKAQILKKIYATLLFECFKQGELSKTRFFWLKSIQINPFLLLNRGIWSIGLTTFLRSGKISLDRYKNKS